MITMQSVREQLTGKDIVDALVKVMVENSEDFAEAQERYSKAIRALQKELGAGPVKDEVEAIYKQTASNLFYAGVLGIKANLDNFIDPVRRSFLDVDFEAYLRENTAKRLPAYANAQEVRSSFFSSLSTEQREIHEAVTAYVSCLETVGPKLAHYYGYLLGNDILYWCVPGYHPDAVQTSRYRMMLEEYLR